MSVFNSTSAIATGSSTVVDCYLTESLATKTCKVIALCAILFGGCTGNILIVIVLYKNRELRKTINYFVLNMAISDFFMLLAFIPLWLTWTMKNGWSWLVEGKTGLVFCKLSYFFTNTSMGVSVQSLVWIALDRFFAVVFPMKFRLFSSKVRTTAIVSTWIVAVVIVSPPLLPTKVMKFRSSSECEVKSFYLSNEATVTKITYDQGYVAALLMTALLFITFFYSVIAITLKRQSKYFANNAGNRHNLKKRQAVKMSFSIMPALYICYLPALVNLLCSWYARKLMFSCLYVNVVSFLVIYFFYASSTVNPIICFAFVRSYRRGLRYIMPSCRKNHVISLDKEMIQRQQVTLKAVREKKKD